MLLSALKTMAAGAMQDRVAAAGALVATLFLCLTAWVLGVAALVVWLAARLGTAGALAAVAGGMVLAALFILLVMRRRNRMGAEARAATRALWAATAVNAASMVLRRGQTDAAEATAAEGSGGTHRSTLLIVGGLALILLAFLFPSTKPPGEEDGPDATA